MKPAAAVAFTVREHATIRRAMRLLEDRLRYDHEVCLGSSPLVRQYMLTRFAGLEHEEFHVLFLNTRNRLLATETMFRGTLTQTSVYPREVVKAALDYNAASVIFAHNHPSGVNEPSQADRMLTDHLKQALKLVDVTVLDHIIAAGPHTYSFAEHGLI